MSSDTKIQVDMTDRANGRRSESDSAENRAEDEPPAGTETIEAYEVENGVVLYDAENPLAWVQSTDAITLAERA